MLPFYSLDQLKDPEVVKMCDTQCETTNTGDNERSDLPLFHEHQAVGCWSADARIFCTRVTRPDGAGSNELRHVEHGQPPRLSRGGDYAYGDRCG